MPTRRAAPSLTPTPNAAKAPTREALAAALAERERELAEALERQKASAEVLSAISKSVADAAPVFETILDACQRLFGSEEIGVYTIGDDDMVRVAAWRGPRAEEVRGDVTPVGESVTGRIIRERRTHHIPDLAAEPDLSPTVRDRVNRLGGASLLYAPMLSEDRGLGSILVVRSPPKPFAEREKALLQSFADQAAIAIQNSRLFRETQDALQQQTATADVLKIISRSAFDLNQATTTILAAAARLCRAPLATLHLRDGEVCRLVTQFGLPEAFERQAREAPIPVRYPLHSRLPARAGEVAHFPDAWTDPDYLYKATARLGGYRAIVVIPMMREDELVGIFSLGRPEPEPFTPGQIKLVQTFADQAAIAIENARLFNEVKSRTDDLTEALQQQTATADVLKVISRSAFDLQTVFDTLLGSAVALSGADSGVLGVRDGDAFRCRSFVNKSPDLVRFLSENPIAPGPGSIMGRVALSGRIEWIEDTLADSALSMRVVIRRTNDDRALVGVPLLRDARIEGAIVLGRSEPGRFSARSIELVQTFADQAVIAIENVRLFDEVQAKTRDLEDALQQQTATSNVLQVISRSAFDLQAVLTTLAESARDLCGASFVTLFMREGDAMRLRAESGCTPEIVKFLHENPIRAGRETFTGRVMLSGEAVHLTDVLGDPDYNFGEAPRIGNYRAALGVPLLRNGQVEGVFALARPEPSPFSERQIEMVRAFADQALIAVENARLFSEVQARTRELTASLDDLRKAQDRLIQSEKLASLGQLTAGIAHEIKNPLNFINNFSALSRELIAELRETLEKSPLDETHREEAEDLIGMVAANLDKVVSHGKRADSIVKNMLLHSREGSGERASVNVNAMVEEALNLAYHGARAEKPGFNVTIGKSLDDKAGAAELYPQEMTRVLLNLISNGFYATTKRKEGEGGGSYEPTVIASTRDLGHSVEIAIRDNGTGISEQVKAKMFNPFFTTKPAGEGTGLGLSLSHDIVVKQHGGTLEVSTEPGSYTQFTIVLPRAGGAA